MTLFSSKTYYVKFQSNTKSKIKVEDREYELPSVVEVIRSKKDLKVLVFSDTITKEIKIKSKLDPKFWYGNLIPSYLGFLVDLTSQKRFYYGDIIKIEKKGALKDSITYTSKGQNIFSDEKVLIDPPKKGNLKIVFSLPLFFNLNLVPENQVRQNYTSLLGISLGLDYHYSKNKFLNLNVTNYTWAQNSNDSPPKQNTDSFYQQNFDPYQNEYSSATSSDISLTNNHIFRRFSFGYGLSYAKYNWYKVNKATLENINSKNSVDIKKYNAIGLSLSTHFQIINNLYAGVVFKPTFYRPSLLEKFNYEHILYFDLAYKLNIF